MDFLFPGIYIVEETAEFHDHVIHEATQKESFDKKEDAHEFSTKAVPAQKGTAADGRADPAADHCRTGLLRMRPASSMVMVDRGEIFSKGKMATK